MEVVFCSNAIWMSEFLSETSICDTWCLCYDRLTYKFTKSYDFVYYEGWNWPCVAKNEEKHSFFLNAFRWYHILPWKTMFHSRDSPRLLVCDTGLYMEQNDIGFITVAICGGYISKYPRLSCLIKVSQIYVKGPMNSISIEIFYKILLPS